MAPRLAEHDVEIEKINDQFMSGEIHLTEMNNWHKLIHAQTDKTAAEMRKIVLIPAIRQWRPGGKKVLDKIKQAVKELDEFLFGKDETEELDEKESEKTGSGIKILKQADGSYRWVGWVSNHFRDNDNPPEIISGEAHKEFVEYADKEGKYPELWLWHVPGSKIGKADMLDFADGFLIASGTFDDEETAESLAGSEDALTMSHGFMRLQKAKDLENVTMKYRIFEASVTPEGVEANPWTRFTTTEEKMGLSENKKAFLSKYLPQERITEIENDTEGLRKAAEEAGVDWKAFEESEEVKPDIQVADVIAGLVEPVTAAVIEHLEMGKLSEMVEDMKAANESLIAQVAALTTQVKELSKSDDEKVAQVITPKAAKAFSWMDNAASHSSDTLLKEGDLEDDKLKTSKPFMVALSEAAAQLVAKG